MMSDAAEELPRYTVVVSDAADAEARSAHQWLCASVTSDYADRWLEGLVRTVEALSYLPHRHPVARENDLSEVEIRRMLYYGPTRRRQSGSTYRILFQIVEPEGEGEGLVRVLHIWHGAQGRRLP
jgi:plasmid stabilization system protein ParE